MCCVWRCRIFTEHTLGGGRGRCLTSKVLLSATRCNLIFYRLTNALLSTVTYGRPDSPPLTTISPQRTEHLPFPPIFPLTSRKIQTLFSLKLSHSFRFPVLHSTHISPRQSRVVSYKPRKLMKSSQISLTYHIACLSTSPHIGSGSYT